MVAPVAPVNLLSASEAAKRLGVTPTMVRRYIDHKQLVGTKVGGVWLLSEADVHAFTPRPSGRPVGYSPKGKAAAKTKKAATRRRVGGRAGR